MLRYYTIWNAILFSFSLVIPELQHKLVLSSTCTTSLIGFYIAHIYPRTVSIYISKSKRYYFSRMQVITGDIILHHIPFLYTVYFSNSYNHGSEFAILPFMSAWILYNRFRNLDLSKIYKIPIENIIFCSVGITIFTHSVSKICSSVSII